jgi:hypothetical protein
MDAAQTNEHCLLESSRTIPRKAAAHFHIYLGRLLDAPIERVALIVFRRLLLVGRQRSAELRALATGWC